MTKRSIKIDRLEPRGLRTTSLCWWHCACCDLVSASVFCLHPCNRYVCGAGDAVCEVVIRAATTTSLQQVVLRVKLWSELCIYVIAIALLCGTVSVLMNEWLYCSVLARTISTVVLTVGHFQPFNFFWVTHPRTSFTCWFFQIFHFLESSHG